MCVCVCKYIFVYIKFNKCHNTYLYNIGNLFVHCDCIIRLNNALNLHTIPTQNLYLLFI